jgi:hypothetical protein
MRSSVYDDEVLQAAANWAGVSVDAMLGPKRYRERVKARRVAAIAFRILGYSYPEIGLMMGGRDHSSIINLVNRANDEMWDVATEIVERARQRTFVLRFRPQVSFKDSLEWQIINPRTGTEISLPLGLSEDLSAALKAGGMDE